jgi:hypothetical protein
VRRFEDNKSEYTKDIRYKDKTYSPEAFNMYTTQVYYNDITIGMDKPIR